MKKHFSFLAIAACGVVLFASCQSSEAVTHNLLECKGYRYNIVNAQQFVANPDTLYGVGFEYTLVLNAPGIGIDTLENNDNKLYYSYPTDGRKFAQLYVYLRSPGLNEICEGTYTVGTSGSSKRSNRRSENEFFIVSEAYMVSLNSENNGTKVITYEDMEIMGEQNHYTDLEKGTITIKKGMAAYDIEINAIDENDDPVVGRYTGFVPKLPKIILTL